MKKFKKKFQKHLNANANAAFANAFAFEHNPDENARNPSFHSDPMWCEVMSGSNGVTKSVLSI